MSTVEVHDDVYGLIRDAIWGADDKDAAASYFGYEFNYSTVEYEPKDPMPEWEQWSERDWKRRVEAAKVEREQQERLQAPKKTKSASKAAQETHHVVSSWESVDLTPALRGEALTQPPSVLSRDDGVKLFYPKRINAVLGETESCKSWLVTQATKEELDVGHHVVFIDFEDSPEALVERLQALGASAESIERHLTYIQPAGKFDELAVAVMQEKIRERGIPTFVVGDGVTEAMAQVGLDPNDGPDVVAFYASWPNSFAATGAAVALVDHVTKSAEGRGRWAIGSERKLSGLSGAAYSVEVLAPFGRGRTGKMLLKVSKDRPGYVRQHQGAKHVIALLELKSWPDGGVTMSVGPPEVGGEGPFRPTHLMHKLSESIAASPGLSKRALRSAVAGNNDAKDLALELLIADGYVRVESGSNNSHKHFSSRPYISVEEVR